MRVSVLGPISRSAGWTVFRLRIEAPGTPVLALLPPEARIAVLYVNGVARQHVGRDVLVGERPFGHGASAFRLSGLRPSDRVEVRESGSRVAPRIVGDLDVLEGAFGIGFWAGAFYAVLATVVIFGIVATFSLRDVAIAWYLGAIASSVGIELTRNGPPLGQREAGELLVVANVAVIACLIGFTTAFLRLLTEARRTLVLCLSFNVVLLCSTAAYASASQHFLDVPFLCTTAAISVLSLVVVAESRRRAGNASATYLIVGLCGIVLACGTQIASALSGMSWPFLNRWAFEIGGTFNALVLSFIIHFRARSATRERARVDRELREATFAATHDPLTGLLNRRGLEEWVLQSAEPRGTVLFIDLDDFKSVNDNGGHAAGDRTLSIVAKILRHSVRDSDVVARVGGDEFVVVLVDCDDDSLVADVSSRISSSVARLEPLGAGDGTRIGASVGIGSFEDRVSFADTLGVADADAYRRKVRRRGSPPGSRRARPASANR